MKRGTSNFFFFLLFFMVFAEMREEKQKYTSSWMLLVVYGPGKGVARSAKKVLRIYASANICGR